jgi:hypothetical protein
MDFLQFVAIFFIAIFTRVISSPTIDNQSVINYRLPNNSLPLHYFLRIETDIHEGAEKFKGLARIRIKITDPTDVITMHGRNETISIKSIDLYDYEGKHKLILNISIT